MTREDAIWWVNHLFEIRKEEYFNKGMLQDAREVDKARQIVIYALQTEVVRCGECRHKYMKDFDMFCPYMVGIIKPNMHCSYGERREP